MYSIVHSSCLWAKEAPIENQRSYFFYAPSSFPEGFRINGSYRPIRIPISSPIDLKTGIMQIHVI